MIIINIFVFCITLFLYLHVIFHLKTSDDLEVFEMDDPHKQKLEEICDIRQPTMFRMNNAEIITTTKKDYLIEHYGAFDVKIRNMSETFADDGELYIPAPLHASNKLFTDTTNTAYLSEKNGEFLQESGVVKNMKYNDEFLRPRMVSNCSYDVMMGGCGTRTPFRYDLNYRSYFMVTQGVAKLKLSPPKSIKYLHPNYDYENFEFSSPINPWNPQPKYSADFNKIKCLDIVLKPQDVMFIPSYWWHSFEFGENTSISCFYYRTYMNVVATMPYRWMYLLQIQNVTRQFVKKMDIDPAAPVVFRDDDNASTEVEDLKSTDMSLLPGINDPIPVETAQIFCSNIEGVDISDNARSDSIMT